MKRQRKGREEARKKGGGTKEKEGKRSERRKRRKEETHNKVQSINHQQNGSHQIKYQVSNCYLVAQQFFFFFFQFILFLKNLHFFAFF